MSVLLQILYVGDKVDIRAVTELTLEGVCFPCAILERGRD